MKILITAFEPFGGHETNCSELVLNSMDTSNLPFEVVKVVLPTTLSCFKELTGQLDLPSFDYVLHLGESALIKVPNLESRAKNILNFKKKDNAGNLTVNQNIVDGGPQYLLSPIKIQELSRALDKLELKHEISKNAGEFICNFIYYSSLKELVGTKAKCLFIHLPLVKEQVGGDFKKDELPRLKAIVRFVYGAVSTLISME